MTSHLIDFSRDNPVDCAAYLVQRLDAAKFWPEEQTIDTLAQQVAQLESSLSTLQKEVAQLRVAAASEPTTTQSPRVIMSTANMPSPELDLAFRDSERKNHPR